MGNTLYASLEKNKTEFERLFLGSADYYFKNIKISGISCAVVMCEDLTDFMKLWQVFLKPLNDMKEVRSPEEIYEYINNDTTIPFNPSPVTDFEQAMFFLTAGFALLIIDGINRAMVMPVQSYPARGVEKPTNENNLRGSKESFTDTGRKNMGMIRRRIRSEKLEIITLQAGERTKTEITIYSHSDFCPDGLVEEVKRRIEDARLPMIMESGYIAPFIDTTIFSLFQSVIYTERPDTFCAKICEGKVGIIVDGTPHRMIYPGFFKDNFIANDDYTERPYFASFIRILRYISFFIATVLPGIYIALTSYAPQTLSDKMIFKIFSSRYATPLPLFAEAMMIIILFEIIKEAGLRLPSPIGSSVSIVSALIIGDAAIGAGLIGSTLLIVCATSTIASFIIPAFYEPIIVLRLLFVLCAGIFGIPGVVFASFFMMLNIINVNSAGYNYLHAGNTTEDGIIKNSWRNHKDKEDILKNAQDKE